MQGAEWRQVCARRIAADGSPIGNAVLIDAEASKVNMVNPYESAVPRPDVGYSPQAGSYLVVYGKRPMNSANVYGSWVTPAGTGASVGALFQVAYRGYEPRVAYDPLHARFAVVSYSGAPAQLAFSFVFAQ